MMCPNGPSASGGAINQSMGYFHSGFYNLGGQELYVSRTGWTGELRFEIYTQGARTDCKRLWKHLFDIGIPHGMVFGSIASMQIRRIEAGILDNDTDMDTTLTPCQAGLVGRAGRYPARGCACLMQANNA